jgi:hypothetical protein
MKIFGISLMILGLVVLVVGSIVILAKRGPKCSTCGWREGHRMDCVTLYRLVEADVQRERAILAAVDSGEMDPAEAMRLIVQP